MAVTVVRGFVGKSSADGGSDRQAKTNPSSDAANSHTQSGLGSALARTSEAVVSALRVTKYGASGEKIRNLSDAEKLGKEVASRIAKDEDPATQAHAELSPHSARQHFA